jgi:hypothetical protein
VEEAAQAIADTYTKTVTDRIVTRLCWQMEERKVKTSEFPTA